MSDLTDNSDIGAHTLHKRSTSKVHLMPVLYYSCDTQ